jgi:8-oxo-dGTP diphosphatase
MLDGGFLPPGLVLSTAKPGFYPPGNAIYPRHTFMILHVAVGAIFNAHGEVLLSKRSPHVHQGNLWEFPGGKLQPGEEARQALSRELGEELGIKVLQARPLLQVPHVYPDRAVLLDTWRVDGFAGTACGQEGQPLVWVHPEDLPAYSFPTANRPIITAVRLPSVYLITPEPTGDWSLFLRYLRRALDAGVRLVQLRAKQLSPKEYQQLSQKVHRLCSEYGAIFLVNTLPAWAMAWGADGVHLTSKRLLSLSQRPVPLDKWVAASCHNEKQLCHAAKIGIDFVVLGPILATPSHPDAPPLGWERLQALIAPIPIPVYALGGVAPGHLERAWDCGAQGVAAIRAWWKTDSSIAFPD